jgi:hypothetical protein
MYYFCMINVSYKEEVGLVVFLTVCTFLTNMFNLYELCKPLYHADVYDYKVTHKNTWIIICSYFS